jgi:gas vesicle protein
MSQKDWIEVGASLLGGIGIGASLMYFFDPQLGDERREQCFETTGEYLSSAGERLGETWQTVANKARDVGEGVAETAGDWSSRAGKLARRYVSGAGSAASDYAGDAAGTARSWGRSAAKTARGYTRGAGDWLGVGGGSRQTSGSIAGITAGVVGALALGAGLMFLLDPTQGRRRRALIRDKAVSYTNEATRYAQSTGRHLSNKAQGLAHRAGEAASQVKDQAQNLASKARDTIRGNRGDSGGGGASSGGFAATSGQSSRSDTAFSAPNCPPGLV